MHLQGIARAFQRLGLLKIVDSPKDIPREGAKSEIPGDVAGVWDGKRLWLVSRNIPRGDSAGVFLHEGSHASFKDMLGKRYPDLVNQFHALREKGDKYATYVLYFGETLINSRHVIPDARKRDPESCRAKAMCPLPGLCPG